MALLVPFKGKKLPQGRAARDGTPRGPPLYREVVSCQHPPQTAGIRVSVFGQSGVIHTHAIKLLARAVTPVATDRQLEQA